MNPRCPLAALDEREQRRVRELLRDKGEAKARRLLGNIAASTVYKAGCGVAVARLTVEVIRLQLDRIDGGRI
jgi:hypothetical protein